MVDPEEERYVAEEQLANGSKDCVAIANCHLEKKCTHLAKEHRGPAASGCGQRHNLAVDVSCCLPIMASAGLSARQNYRFRQWQLTHSRQMVTDDSMSPIEGGRDSSHALFSINHQTCHSRHNQMHTPSSTTLGHCKHSTISLAS